MEAVIVAVITSILAPLVLAWRMDKKQQTQEKFDELAKRIDEVYVGNLRLQILNLIQHNPENKSAILSLYDEYKSRGANSYIKEVVKQWQKKRNS